MDRNQNRGSEPWRSDQDWNPNRPRFNQQSDSNQNREDYGSSDYGYNQGRGMQSRREYRGMENQGDYYRRRNYIPDNDENRYDYDRDYESTPYGTSGTYGYRGTSGRYSGTSGMYSGMGSSRSGYGGMGEGRGYYGRQGWQREETGDYGDYGTGYGRSYGSEPGYGSESDYGRMMGEARRESMYRYRPEYGGRYERERYERRNRGEQDRGWWDRTRDEVSSWFGDEDAERRREMDRRYEGGYRGKGPKAYHRSEERIKEDVCDRLTDDDMLDATDIEVEVQNDEVVLTGRVNNRMQKRRAEDLAESVSGVRNVENRLRIGSNVTLTDATEGTSSMLTQESRESSIH